MIDREPDCLTRLIKEAIHVHIRKEGAQSMDSDEGSYQLSHAYDRFLGMSSSSSRRAWRLVGWLGFNGTFCTNRPYRAIKKIKVC